MGFSGQLWPIFENKGEKGDKGDKGDPGVPAPHANLTGEVTSIGNETTVTNAAVINKLLTGFSAAAGIVAAADSIITTFNKIVGNLALKAPLLSPSFTTPALGTPASGNLSNCSFPTLNQNTSGSSASCIGNAATATTLIGDQTNWASYRTGAVANMLSWKNYGNGHVIFDASNATTPTGAACNATNSAAAWTASYPTLMGWNGSQTYGVRVDSARIADNLNGAWAQMPTGTRLVFAQAAAPTGWVQITDDGANNRMLRVVNTAGGGVAGSHSPILNNVVAAHTHGFTTGTVSADHTHTTTTGTESADHAHYTTTGGISANHTHTFTGNAMGNHDHPAAAHTHTVPTTTVGNGTINNRAWIMGTGNNSTTITTSSTTVNVTPASAGTPSGSNGWVSSDHSHAGWSGGRNAAHTHTGTSGGISANHTHSGSTDNGSSSTNWTPRYIDTIICSKS